MDSNRRSSVAGLAGGVVPPVPPGMEKYPLLWEFLADPCWSDGKRRETGTLTLFAEAGGMKGCLADRDADAVAFRSGSGLTELLRTLEKGLAEGGLDWRASKGRKTK